LTSRHKIIAALALVGRLVEEGRVTTIITIYLRDAKVIH